MTDMWGEIGKTAGEIYTAYVGKKRSVKVVDVKKKIKNKGLVDYAIGWLLREGKVEIKKTGKGAKAAMTIKVFP